MTPAGLQPRTRRSIPWAAQQLELRMLLSGAPAGFIDPHPQVGNQFGATVTPVANGDVVITSPNDDAGGGSTVGNTGAGAVYLYNGQTGALISTLTGSHAGDQLSSGGVTSLTNGNFVIDSPKWNGSRGAVTWGNGALGLTGIVSSTNSLVGTLPNDQVGGASGGGITALGNGNYVVDSPAWNNSFGAVTWGSGTSGVTGAVSAINSLVGNSKNDSAGSSGVTKLINGNYVVDSPFWNNKTGAVTWSSGTAGITGPISATNSLVGSSKNDSVGINGVASLSNGNFVVDSPLWNNNIGAVTWSSGTVGITGPVSATNSLVGDVSGDEAGSDGVVTLKNNGNYVVISPNWTNASASGAGAVTFGNGTTGVMGLIIVSNSLVGSTTNDKIGADGVTALSNGNYVVDSWNWNDSANAGVGAVTWGSGITGVTGVVTSANSLVGSNSNDFLGSAVTVLNNGNYVVDSSLWDQAVGAVTWGDGTLGTAGVVSSSNSLVGSTTSDSVGWGGVTPLTNGNYVVDSGDWNNGSAANAGAVTWGSGTTGVAGVVSPANSLVGSTSGDHVGFEGITALSNGNYVVDSQQWYNGTVANAGAVTFGNGTKGVTGAVGVANSLFGITANDQLGSGGIIALSNGNYLVVNSNWSNGVATQAGAVTFGNGLNGVTGVVNSANSLVGTTPNDAVGIGGVTVLNNSNYIVDSSNWFGDVGAVTFGNGTTGVNGFVNNQNSLLGMSASAVPSTIGIITDNSNGLVYAKFPEDGSGHVYRGSTSTGFSLATISSPSIAVTDSLGKVTNGTGTLDFGNAILGVPVTQVITVTNYGTAPLIVQPVTVPSGFSVSNNFKSNQSISAGSSVQFTLQLNAASTGSYSGLVTITSNDPSASPFRFNVTGTVTKSAALQFVDPHPEVGNLFGNTVTPLLNGNVVITAQNDDAGGGSTAAGTGAGAVYLYNGQTGALISTLIGSHTGDQLGSSGVTILTNGNYVIDSPKWNGGLGAVTLGNGSTGVTRTVSSANSLVGTSSGDSLGSGGITALSNGNYVVDSSSWNNGANVNAGAVTWGSGTTGVTGVVSLSNSLVGSSSGDFVGFGGVTALSNGNYVVDSSSWNNGVGAVTWGGGKTGVSGVVSSTNSLIGSASGDFVGFDGVTLLSNGNYVVDSSYWNNGVGAVTWGSGKTGVTGVVSSTNSLVGSTSGDFVGYGGFGGGITALSNGNYVVDSWNWNNSLGAVTWCNGTTASKGVVSSTNSLVGSTPRGIAGDAAKLSVTALSNGNYVVDAPYWNNGLGAVTWGSGTKGVDGTVSAANSLIGSTSGDNVGSYGVTALSNGNYVVDSANWDNGTGAVTWGNGTMGIDGIVSATKSLIGSRPGDYVGDGGWLGGVTALTNGNYVVESWQWNNLTGAVTFGSGTTGVTGFISSANSLVGSTSGDHVGMGYGGVTELNNGNYVVPSYAWNGGAGAVTWGSGTTGIAGPVSALNSLVGSTSNDNVGSGGVTALSNGNYVVDSYQWYNGAVANAGAVTFGNGTKGVTGPVSVANSLVGITANDQLGSNGIIALSNGNYLVNSPNLSNNLGGVTFTNGTTGISGSNSLLGQSASSNLSNVTIQPDNAHRAVYVVPSGSGIVYRGSTATGFLNLTYTGPSIVVSDYSSAVNNGVGLVDFGTSNLGTPLTQTITVTNYGNAPLIVQPVTVPAGFSIVPGTNFTANQSIASGASASFTIQLNANLTATSSGVVTIPNNVSTGSPFTFNVTGTLVSPKIVVQQGTTTLANGSGTVNLGSTLVGTSVTQIITVLNNGNIPLALTSVSVPSGYSIVAGIDFTRGQSIAPGASATFTLQLNATATGSPSGTVTIGSNDTTASPFTFNVIGTVTAPKIVVQQGLTVLANGTGTVNLGTTPVGRPATAVVTVTNIGNAPLIVQPVTVPAGFSIVAGTNFTPNQLIAIGSSASFTLQLTATATGAFGGVVAIADSDTTASPFMFNVKGIVRAIGATDPVLVVQQGANTLTNGTSTIYMNGDSTGSAGSQIITVTNQGNGPLVLQPVTVPSGFNVVNNFAVNQSVAVGASVSLTLQLNAKATGTPYGVVTIQDNDPTASSFTFNVVANHRPTAISLNSNLVSTNLTSATMVGSLTTTDPDSKVLPQTYSYSIASPTFLNGPTAVPVFSVDGQGNLMLAAAAPVGVYNNVSITDADQGGLSLTQNFTIYVAGASTTGVAASTSVASGTPGSTTIATLPTSATTVLNTPAASTAQLATAFTNSVVAIGFSDSVEPSVLPISQNTTSVIGSITYQLGVGGDNGDFTIDSNGHLQTATSLDASVKSSYHITIISTNTITGVSTINPYTITVVPVLAPVISVTPTTLTLAESSPNGTVVGTVSASDVLHQKLTYAITSGNVNGAFVINSTTGQITVANSSVLLLTTNPTFALTVQATDSVSSGSATITINLARMTLSNNSIASNAARGTIVGQFATTQPGSSNTYHYSLVPGKADDFRFKIDANGNLTVNTSLNAVIRNSYTIDVTSTDQNQRSLTQTFQITILGPSNITLSNNSVARSSGIGTVVGQLTTTDAGTGNVLTYTLPSNRFNNADFKIDASGNLILNVNLSSNRRRVLLVDVVVTDQRGLSLNKLFAVFLK